MTIEFTTEEINFLRAAILEVRVAGSVQDIIDGKLELSDLTKGILEKLTVPSEVEPEPETESE